MLSPARIGVNIRMTEGTAQKFHHKETLNTSTAYARLLVGVGLAEATGTSQLDVDQHFLSPGHLLRQPRR